MNKNVLWATIFSLLAGLLQSSLLARLAIYQAVPDIALGIVVYTAYTNGIMSGQLTGFFSGLALDFLSAAPMGLNAFIRTMVGAAAGLLNGTFFMDSFLLPMALCAGATLGKALFLLLLNLIFSERVRCYSIYEPLLWVELAMNTLLAPLLFGLLRLFNPLLINRRDT